MEEETKGRPSIFDSDKKIDRILVLIGGTIGIVYWRYNRPLIKLFYREKIKKGKLEKIKRNFLDILLLFCRFSRSLCCTFGFRFGSRLWSSSFSQ